MDRDYLCPKGWAWMKWDCDFRPFNGFGECWACEEKEAPIQSSPTKANQVKKDDKN